MKKLLNQIKHIINFLFFTAVLISGCSKEKPRTDFVARVNDSYLTKEDLTTDFGSGVMYKSRKDEYVRNWIETEILYKEAVDANILKDDEYIRAVEKSKKELAKAFLIRKISEKNKIILENQELQNYYNKFKKDFELFAEHYLFNIIIFNDEDKAILFRSTLIESDWNKATNVFKGDPSISYIKEREFLDANKVNPAPVLIMLQELLNDEVSIVINTGLNSYTVVQLLKKYNTGEIPEFDVIKDRVINRLTMIKTRQVYESYLKDLYGKYQIEIK